MDAAATQISEVAADRNVSESMVAYRYWRAGTLDAAIYRRLAAAYAARWQNARTRRRELRQEAADSGPSYYTVRKHRLSRPLINLVERSLRSNELTHTKATLILGAKPSNVEPLLGDCSLPSRNTFRHTSVSKGWLYDPRRVAPKTYRAQRLEAGR